MNYAYTRALAISNAHEKEIAVNCSAVRNDSTTEQRRTSTSQEEPAYYDTAITKLNTAVAVNPTVWRLTLRWHWSATTRETRKLQEVCNDRVEKKWTTSRR